MKPIRTRIAVLLCFSVYSFGLNCFANEKHYPPRLGSPERVESVFLTHIASTNQRTTKDMMIEKNNLFKLIKSEDADKLLRAVKIEERYPGIIRSIIEDADQFELEYRDYRKLVFALSKAANSEEELFLIASNKKLNWYTRQSAIHAINIAHDLKHIYGLIGVLKDNEDVGEVRKAVLDAITDNDLKDLLPVVQELFNSMKQGEWVLGHWNFADRELLDARGLLGDRTAVKEIIERYYITFSDVVDYEFKPLTADDSNYEFKPLILLMKSLGGLKGMLDEIDNFQTGSLEDRLKSVAISESNEYVRRWALERMSEINPEFSSPVLVQLLGDKSWTVPYGAYKKLLKLKPIGLLEAAVTNSHLKPEQRLFAAYTLLNLDEKLPIPINSIPTYPKEIVPPIPEHIRSAIIRYWVPKSLRGTDIRWLIEEKLLEPKSEYKPILIKKFLNEIEKQGLGSFSCKDSGEVMGSSGASTYCIVKIDEADVCLSYIGPYFSFGNTVYQEDKSILEKIEKIANRIGLYTLGDEGRIIFPGMNIYFFGDREPLPIADLIFYWQD